MKQRMYLIGLTLCVLILLGCVPWFFPTNLTGLWDDQTRHIADGFELIKTFRLPRLMVAGMIGAVLALSGMIYQAMLQNPLAEPFILGVASGAALGVALVIHFGISVGVFSIIGLSSTAIGAFLGALAVSGLIYLLSFRHLEKTLTLLLVGVILNFFISSLIMLLQAIGEPHKVLAMIDWMMGRLTLVESYELWQLAVISGLFLLAIYRLSPHLNLLSLGRVATQTRGLSLKPVISLLFIMVSLVVGYAVSLAGPIGFVGLIVPHIVRITLGNDHRQNWPVVALLGAVLLMSADLVAQTMLYPADLPVGVITSILGAPLFLYLLLSNK
ncbi:MAG: iron ABC transporter permease [Xanthomonadaceae bacterium]|nr:iron ABC transporter permease [Xanthomonadaceae bacterium]